MKQLNQYIIEKFKINSKSIKKNQYSCQPKDKDELISILKERLEKDKNADLNDIDVSNITDMFRLFVDLDPYNIDISEWDVSNVTTMRLMFFNCKHFNCDLSGWNVENCEDMYKMFSFCSKYEGKGLNNWNIKNLNIKDLMFQNCENLINTPDWYD